MSGSVNATISARRPLGYFDKFNKFWNDFYLQNGRRPTKTDIETWRAENLGWRPELTLEEIVQHSKGRRDPEKNRQYFVEYRRKLRKSGKRPMRRRGRGRQAAAKRPEASEPWEDATSDDDPAGEEEEAGSDDEAAQEQMPMCNEANLQNGDDPLGPHSPTDQPATATHLQLGSAVAAAVGVPAAASIAVQQDVDQGAEAGDSKPLLHLIPPAAAATVHAPAGDAHAAPVPMLIWVRRSRGPMAAKLLRCAVLQSHRGGGAARDWRSGSPRAPHVLGHSHPVSPAPCPVPAAVAAAAVGDSNTAVSDVCLAAAAASASVPYSLAPPVTALNVAAYQGHVPVGEGTPQQPAPQHPADRFLPAEAAQWNPGLLAANTGPLGFPCWPSGGGAWYGAPSGWLPPGLTAMPGSVPGAAWQLGAVHTQQPGAPASVPPAAQVTGGLQRAGSSEGAAPAPAGSPAHEASTAPFYDADLHRTCSSGSINTGGIAGAPGPPASAAVANQSPSIVLAAAEVTGNARTAAVTGAAPTSRAKRACPPPIPSWSSVGDVAASCAPCAGGGSPSASTAGAVALAGHDEQAQHSSKRQRTASVGTDPQLPCDAPPLASTLDWKLVSPPQVGGGRTSCAPPSFQARGGAGQRSGGWVSERFPASYTAVPVTGFGGNAVTAVGWLDAASTAGGATLAASAHTSAAATPCGVPVPAALAAAGHVAAAAAASTALEQQPQSGAAQAYPCGGMELEGEADVLGSTWLDNLFDYSELESLLADPFAAQQQQQQQREAPESMAGTLGPSVIDGLDGVAAWSALMGQGLRDSLAADAVCSVGPG